MIRWPHFGVDLKIKDPSRGAGDYKDGARAAASLARSAAVRRRPVKHCQYCSYFGLSMDLYSAGGSSSWDDPLTGARGEVREQVHRAVWDVVFGEKLGQNGWVHAEGAEASRLHSEAHSATCDEAIDITNGAVGWEDDDY